MNFGQLMSWGISNGDHHPLPDIFRTTNVLINGDSTSGARHGACPLTWHYTKWFILFIRLPFSANYITMTYKMLIMPDVAG